MKKQVVLCAALAVMIIVPHHAWSNEVTAAPGQAEHPMDMMARPDNGPAGAPEQEGTARRDPREEAENFQEHKAELLKRINAHLAEVQQHLTCVQSANDPQTLHACKPPRRPHEDGRRGPMHQGMPPGAMGGHNPSAPDMGHGQNTTGR